MLHMAIIRVRSWGGGAESIAKIVGSGDKHAANGSNYSWSHNFLTVTYETFWRVNIEPT